MLYKLIKIKQLKQHEKIITKHFNELKEQITQNNYIIPIIVDSKNNIILDGHHRYNVLKSLGYEKIPAYLIDYDSNEIKVSSWRTNINVNKTEVVERGNSGELYPPKTSRHTISGIKPIKVNLGDLA